MKRLFKSLAGTVLAVSMLSGAAALISAETEVATEDLAAQAVEDIVGDDFALTANMEVLNTNVQINGAANNGNALYGNIIWSNNDINTDASVARTVFQTEHYATNKDQQIQYLNNVYGAGSWDSGYIGVYIPCFVVEKITIRMPATNYGVGTVLAGSKTEDSKTWDFFAAGGRTGSISAGDHTAVGPEGFDCKVIPKVNYIKLFDQAMTDGHGYTGPVSLYGYIEHTMTHHAATAATCTAKGNIEYWSCDYCGNNYNTSDAAATVGNIISTDVTTDKNPTNHTGGTEVRNATAATCGASGYSGDTYCLGCDEKISSGTTTEKELHTRIKVERIEATCEKPGNVEYWACSECNKNYNDAAGTTELTDITIPVSAHNLTRVEAKAATCVATGNVEYWACAECEKIFSDAAGTTETTTEAIKTEIDPNNHTALVYYPAVGNTDTAPGYLAYYHCSGCERYYNVGTEIGDDGKPVVGEATPDNEKPENEDQPAKPDAVGVVYDASGNPVGAYTTFEEAVAAIKTAGEGTKTLKLTKAAVVGDIVTDGITFEGATAIPAGTIIDLNGQTLTASKVYLENADVEIIDSSASATGLLVCSDKDDVVLPKNCGSLPVWNDGEDGDAEFGYRFLDLDISTRVTPSQWGGSAQCQFYFKNTTDVTKLLTYFWDGGADTRGGAEHNVWVTVRFEWDGGSANATFSDATVGDMAKQANGGFGVYSCRVNGIKGLGNLKFSVVLVSGTGAEYVIGTKTIATNPAA